MIAYAKKTKLENGRTVRVDCTVVESNIHQPFDSIQLWDCMRVLTRLLEKTRDIGEGKVFFSDHQRVAKRRMIGIQYAKNDKQREPLYKNLLKYARKTIGYAGKAKDLLENHPSNLESFLLIQSCFGSYLADILACIDYIDTALHGDNQKASSWKGV